MIEPRPSDWQLVKTVLAGRSEAFRVLVDRESRPVIAVCRRILGDPDEAEDVAQDAFLRAYRALATFRGDGSFGPWVTRIAVRLAMARLAIRHETIRVDADDSGEWASALESAGDPEACALGKEQRRAILAAIAVLPAAQREVVVLRFYRDLTIQQIARMTNTPAGTVKSRLHRALTSLRAQNATSLVP